MTWYEELKYMRESLNITLEEATRNLMCSVDALKAYESGERVPRDEMVGRIWKYYNAPEIFS